MIITPISRPDNIRTITAADSPYDVVDIDRVILCNATSGEIVVNLNGLNPLTVKKLETDTTSNAIVLTPKAGQTIQGGATVSLVAPGENLDIKLNGTDWQQFN